MLTKLTTVAYLATVALACIKTNFFEKWKNETLLTLPIALLGLFLIVFDQKLSTNLRIIYGLNSLSFIIADYTFNHDHFVRSVVVFTFAHVFYIVSIADQVKKWWTWLAFLAYPFGIMINIVCFHDKVSEAPIEVAIILAYSFVLITVFVMSGSIWYHQKESHLQLSSLMRLIGFALFILSDNLIIFNRMSIKIPHAFQLIYVTYYTAQLLIFVGNYQSHSNSSHKKAS